MLDIGSCGGTAQQGDELVAAQSAEDVIAVQGASQELSRDLDRGVSRIVAQRVVDRLETVEVDVANRGDATIITRPQRIGQQLENIGAIGQPSQVVVASLVGKAFVQLALRGDVGHGEKHRSMLGIIGVQQKSATRHPDAFAVGAVDAE